MSRHIDEIKELIFDEPDFDDEEVTRKKGPKKGAEKRTAVETIVFRDRAKRKKGPQQPISDEPSNSPVEFDLEKARFDVHKFGIKGFEKSKYEDARVALAVGLGAKPPKQKFINYRELLELNRAKKVKEKEEEENARLLGDIFQKNPNSKDKSRPKSKQKRLGQGDVGAMRFSSVGKFRGGVLKLSENDISKVKSKSRPPASNRKRPNKR